MGVDMAIGTYKVNALAATTKLTVQNRVMSSLFKQSDNATKTLIAELGIKNQQLTRSRAPGFKRGNTTHSKFPSWDVSRLHPSLEKEWSVIEKRTEVDQAEYNTIVHYMRNVFNVCWNVADLFAVVPIELHKHFKKELEDYVDDVPVNLNAHEIQYFQAKFQEDADVIKTRLMKNLLLG
jgi:hypothetical protein